MRESVILNPFMRCPKCHKLHVITHAINHTSCVCACGTSLYTYVVHNMHHGKINVLTEGN